MGNVSSNVTQSLILPFGHTDEIILISEVDNYTELH